MAKITGENFETLKMFAKQGAKNLESVEAYLNDGLTLKRYRWDCLYACPTSSKWICDALYNSDATLNDTHIDTALRRIFGHKK